METDFNLSARLFAGEITFFVIACIAWYCARKYRQLTLAAWILAALTAGTGAAALVFPVRFVLDHASGLRNAHPLILGMLAGAPTMPLVLCALLFLRRHRPG